MSRYKYFKETNGGAAFSDPNNKKDKIDWKQVMFQYPKENGLFVDFKILTNPMDSEWNKRLLVHPFMKTIDSFGAAKEDVVWLGTKKCSGMESREVINCEYCRFVVNELDKIYDIISKLYKDKYDPEMSNSDFGKLVNDLDDKSKKDSKLAKFKGIKNRYRELSGCMQSLNRYIAVYVRGQGVRLMEMKQCVNVFIENRFKEQDDPLNLWIRVENNKLSKKPGEYYKVYKSNKLLSEPEEHPKESMLKELDESQIKAVYKKLSEKEDKEKQLKSLAGDFEKKEEKPKDEEFNYKEEESVDLGELASVDEIDGLNPNESAPLKDDEVSENVVNEDNEDEDEELLLDSLLEDEDDANKETVNPSDKSSPIPVRPDDESDTDDSFNLNMDDDLQSIDELLGDTE